MFSYLNLTPYLPLSLKGEGEMVYIREAKPLFDSPYGIYSFKEGKV